MGAERALRLALLLTLAFAQACATARGSVAPKLAAATESRDALGISDELELLIAEGKDTPADRQYAYEAVKARPEDTAAYTFARAAVTGRVVQQRGLLGVDLVPDVENYARRSRDLEPDFRGGAATRLLGTLYVVAPASFLKYGDSEQGVELLEGLVREHPEVLENHLRLAEAYLSLSDPTPASEHLCIVVAGRQALRKDDQRLLDQLLVAAGPLDCTTRH
jgi:hypothetical protein